MNILFIIVILIMLFFVILILIASCSEKLSSTGKLGKLIIPTLILAIVWVSLVSWSIVAAVQDWRYIDVGIYQITTVSDKGNTIQCVIFCDDNLVNIINVNRFLGKIFDDNQKFVVLKKDPGPYYWLYFPVDKNTKYNIKVMTTK